MQSYFLNQIRLSFLSQLGYEEFFLIKWGSIMRLSIDTIP